MQPTSSAIELPNTFTCETAEDFAKARAYLGLSLLDFGKLLGYTGKHIENQIREMETGKRPIRGAQVRLLELYVCDGVRPPDWDEPEEIEVIEPL